jgi:hypothetical protein
MLAAFLPSAALTDSDISEYSDGTVEQTVESEETDVSIDPAAEMYPIDPIWHEPMDDSPEDAPEPETGNDLLQDDPIDADARDLERVIADYGYAYVMTIHAAVVYSATDMAEPVFTITQSDAVLLAIEYRTHNGVGSVKVCFLTEESELMIGYISAAGSTETSVSSLSTVCSTVPSEYLDISESVRAAEGKNAASIMSDISSARHLLSFGFLCIYLLLFIVVWMVPV